MPATSQDRLDEMLTAATDYRQELAKEIRERAGALSQEALKMQEAASVLDGKPPPRVEAKAVDEEVALLHKQLEELGGELSKAKMAAQRAIQARELLEKETAPFKMPPDAPTVLLRTAGPKSKPGAQVVLSVPAVLRDQLKAAHGDTFQAALDNGRLIFERARVQPEEEKPRPKLVPTILTLEMVRDEIIKRRRFTVKELADHFDADYMRVYNMVRTLVTRGIAGRVSENTGDGFVYQEPPHDAPNRKPRGEPDLAMLGVGADSAIHNVVVPYTRAQGSSGKPGKDKKIARATGRRPVRRGEKR